MASSTSFVAILIALIAASSATTVDYVNDCLTNSYATGCVDAIHTADPGSNQKATSYSDIIVMVDYLITDAMSSTNTFWFFNAFYVHRQTDFYQVLHCGVTPMNHPCVYGYEFLIVVVNVAVYGDAKRRYFAYDGTTHPDYSTPNSVGASAYDFTAESWYTQPTQTWSAQHSTAAGPFVNTYVKVSATIIAGAERVSAESCGFCTDHNAGAAAATALANSNLRQFKGATSRNVIPAIAHTLVDHLKAANTKLVQYFYFAFSDDNFFMIKDCSYVENYGGCAGFPYVLEIVSPKIFGNHYYQFFSLNLDGSVDSSTPITQPTRTTGDYEYYPTQRPWYQAATGWTDEYLFDDRVTTGKSYAVRFLGGVAAVDTVTGVCADAQCAEFTFNFI